MNEHVARDEAAVKKLMASSLTLGPAVNAKGLVVVARQRQRRRRLKFLSLAASLLMIMVATSPFTMPVMARALSAVPVVGSGFEAALKLHSLDLAYEAGLLPSLEKAAERDGVTVTVHTAYRDDETFDILLSFRSGDADLMENMHSHIGPHVQLSSGRWSLPGHYSSKSYDAEEGVLYVSMSSFKPLPWYVRRLEVQASWPIDYSDMEDFKYGVNWDDVELTEPVSLIFPLQSSKWHVPTVYINETITDEHTTVTLERLVFSPVRTILHYSYSGYEPSFRLYDIDGNALRGLTWSSDPDTGVGKMTCVATDSAEVIIRYQGYSVKHEVEVPLLEGYEHDGEPYFKIESVRPVEKELKAYYIEGGGPVIADTEVVLSWTRRDWWVTPYSMGEEHVEDDKVTLHLSRGNLPTEYPLRLDFSHLIKLDREIRVLRTQP